MGGLRDVRVNRIRFVNRVRDVCRSTFSMLDDNKNDHFIEELIYYILRQGFQLQLKLSSMIVYLQQEMAPEEEKK